MADDLHRDLRDRRWKARQKGWTCPNCGRLELPDFDTCMRCGSERPTARPTVAEGGVDAE